MFVAELPVVAKQKSWNFNVHPHRPLAECLNKFATAKLQNILQLVKTGRTYVYRPGGKAVGSDLRSLSRLSREVPLGCTLARVRVGTAKGRLLTPLISGLG